MLMGIIIQEEEQITTQEREGTLAERRDRDLVCRC